MERKNCNVAGPSVAGQSGSNSNGFQVEQALLREQHGGRLEDLGEAPDLLEDDLLPQLEALDQEESTNHSWVNAGLENERQEEDGTEVNDGHDVPGYNSQVRKKILSNLFYMCLMTTFEIWEKHFAGMLECSKIIALSSQVWVLVLMEERTFLRGNG